MDVIPEGESAGQATVHRRSEIGRHEVGKWVACLPWICPYFSDAGVTFIARGQGGSRKKCFKNSKLSDQTKMHMSWFYVFLSLRSSILAGDKVFQVELSII